MIARSASTDAPAKINLFLRVLAPRDDGFHELETLFQAVSLVDRVRVEHSLEGGPDGPTTIEVHGGDAGPDDNNLALRAARAFRARLGIEGSVHVALEKRIPAGAGLGGGSSDAAAVLRCLHALTGVGTPEDLGEVAAGLGSDVPFFLTETGLALARGRGERLVALPPLDERPLVIATPTVHVSTAEAYTAIRDSRVGKVVPEARALAVQDFGDWGGVDALSENDFTAPVVSAEPAVGAAIHALEERLPGPVLLSGSGGASFGFARSVDHAGEVVDALAREVNLPAVAALTLTAAPTVQLTDGRVEGKG